MTLYDTKSGVNISLQSLQKVDTFRLKIANQIKRTKRTKKPQKGGFSFLESLEDMTSLRSLILI